MIRTILLAILLAGASVSLTACGGRTKQTTTVKTTTTGQELADLQRALDEGLIDQKEFDRKRKEILKS